MVAGLHSNNLNTNDVSTTVGYLNTVTNNSTIEYGGASSKSKKDDVLFIGKYKALKAENKKLKEILR